MLYARCGFCGTIVPLWCAGQFMGHRPVLVVGTPNGAYCSACGILPPIFMCMHCGCRQYLMVQGAPFPAAASIGPGQVVAAAVQASPQASEGTLKSGFKAMAQEAGRTFGQEGVQMLFRWFSG